MIEFSITNWMFSPIVNSPLSILNRQTVGVFLPRCRGATLGGQFAAQRRRLSGPSLRGRKNTTRDAAQRQPWDEATCWFRAVPKKQLFIGKNAQPALHIQRCLCVDQIRSNLYETSMISSNYCCDTFIHWLASNVEGSLEERPTV